MIAVLDKNESSEERFVKSLKDDYIVRVKTISYIVDAKQKVEYDIDELQKIASLMSVDKIHFIDETGTIYSGSIPNTLDIALILVHIWLSLNNIKQL